MFSDELKLDKGLPTSSRRKVSMDSNPNQFLRFQLSDLTVDAGKSTVPFIDLQPVQLDPPVLLSGAGLYHKKAAGSSGFLGLKLMTYDITQNIDTVVDKLNKKLKLA